MCQNKAHPDRSDFMMYVYWIVCALIVGALALFGDRFHAHPNPPATHADAGVR